MKCAVGLCGHCQFAGSFICKDGAGDALRPSAPAAGAEGDMMMDIA